MVDKTENELTEKQFYRKLCDIGLYGKDDERKDAIKTLEEMKTVQAVDVLLKILLYHPYGKHCDDCDSSPREDTIMPLLRLWKVAPEKIIPLLPFFLSRIRVSDRLSESNYGAILGAMSNEILQEAFLKGLNDYDSNVRAGVLDFFTYDDYIENNLPLLIEAYKIENNEIVILEIEKIFLGFLNEEIIDELIDLIRNYGEKTEYGYYAIATREVDFDDEEQVRKIVPILLRKWKEEQEEMMKETLKSIIETMLNYFKDKVNELFSKEVVKQLQEMDIIKE